MKILLFVLVSFTCLVYVGNAHTQNFISDPRSTFPKMIRTKSPYQFLAFFMGTFRDMFTGDSRVLSHMNYYDDQVKGISCYMESEMSFAKLKLYFENYSRTRRNPEIKVLTSLMTRSSVHMTAEFHVNTTQKWLGFHDHFHMIIRAVNDEQVGWGVRHLDMALDC